MREIIVTKPTKRLDLHSTYKLIRHYLFVTEALLNMDVDKLILKNICGRERGRGRGGVIARISFS